jgi:hypothetical protein
MGKLLNQALWKTPRNIDIVHASGPTYVLDFIRALGSYQQQLAPICAFR